ncbi:MAG: ECF transporter S component [Oscillospiraceae bacterium]|nr:ECF transporter S component [Oscillospiraceae bacterium]
MKKNRILWLTQLAMLTAIVLLLQMLPLAVGPMQLAAFALIPIVVGGAMLGVGAGVWLGLVFSLVVLFGPDTLAYFMPVSAVGTVVTILARGLLAGAAGGLVYKALQKRNTWAAMICAAAAVPVVNTGVFVLGLRVFFWPLMQEWAGGGSAVAFVFLTMIGANFLIELAATVIISTALLPVVRRLAASRSRL